MALRYTITRHGEGALQALLLDGGQGGPRAEILLHGANVYRWVVGQGADHEFDLLESPSEPKALLTDPWGSGTPVLAPWANRVANAKFAWGDGLVELTPNFPGGHAIHGLVGTMPWSVLSTEEGDGFAEATLAADWTRAGEPRQWPWPFRAELVVRLENLTLGFRLSVKNLSDRTMPAAVGLHPYFRLPFDGGERDAYLLHIPARQRWETDSQVLPTGKTFPVAGSPEDWTRGVAMAPETRLDTLFGDVIRRGEDAGETVCSIVSPKSGALKIRGGAATTFWQVYTPPRDSIAIEPQTCSIDAFNMASRGVDSGMKTLAPGASMEMRAAFEYVPPGGRA
jgi:aldose 1-epimerase